MATLLFDEEGRFHQLIWPLRSMFGSISTGTSRISLQHQTVRTGYPYWGGILLFKGKLCEGSGWMHYSCKCHHTPCGIVALLVIFLDVWELNPGWLEIPQQAIYRHEDFLVNLDSILLKHIKSWLAREGPLIQILYCSTLLKSPQKNIKGPMSPMTPTQNNAPTPPISSVSEISQIPNLPSNFVHQVWSPRVGRHVMIPLMIPLIFH